MRPLERRTIPKRVRDNSKHVREEQRKPNLPGLWVLIGDFVALNDPGNDPDGVTYQSPPYENGFTYAGPPYAYPAFRHGLDGSLEFQGHVDVGSASSGDVMTTLLGIWRPYKDVSWLTDIWDGAAFQVARVAIDSSTGEVTITWPAT